MWTQFSELNLHFKKQAKDEAKLNEKLAELISLATCDKKLSDSKRFKSFVTPEIKEILARTDARVNSLYTALPTNTMLIICTGHGDTAIVHRYIFVITFLVRYYAMISVCFFIYLCHFLPSKTFKTELINVHPIKLCIPYLIGKLFIFLAMVYKYIIIY